MKKVVLTTLATVLALAMMLPLAGTAMAQTELNAEEATAIRLGLAVQAPDSSKAGQPLRIRVVTRPGQRPVERAQVWAVNIRYIESNDIDAEEYAALAERCGQSLGWTNERGYVYPPPRIWQTGKYLLVAIKPNHIPGFARMKIEPRAPLTIRAPEQARVGQEVLMKVTEPVAKPVPRAAVFNIPLRDISDEDIQSGTYDELLRAAQAYVNSLTDTEAAAATDRMRRYLIGFTDRNGELTHKFRIAGPHLLITAKRGYTPDCTAIRIIGLQPEPAERQPVE